MSPASAARRASGDRADVGGAETQVCNTAGTPKAPGDACACDGQCASHFCVDGVCCDQACKEGCKTCNAPDTVGKCVMRKAGDNPWGPGATTLEWTLPSPPPFHQFNELPHIH